MQRQVDECLEEIFKAEGIEAQVLAMKAWAKKSQFAVQLVRIGVGADKVEWNLPEGMPETVKLEEDIPVGMGETTIGMEWRRIKHFFTPDSNMNKLVDWKREQQWINMLEGLHHIEAKIMTAVKDGKLLELYPEMEKLLPEIGIKEWNKPEPPKKKRGRPKKKK